MLTKHEKKILLDQNIQIWLLKKFSVRNPWKYLFSYHRFVMLIILSLLFCVILQIVIKKWIMLPLEWRHKFDSLGFLLVFFYQKMRKNYDNILFNFQQMKYIQKMIFIYFWLKIPFFPKEGWLFCVSLLYVLSSCEVFRPVWWPLDTAALGEEERNSELAARRPTRVRLNNRLERIGSLESVLLSWRTFLLTDLHSGVHLWYKYFS